MEIRALCFQPTGLKEEDKSLTPIPAFVLEAAEQGITAVQFAFWMPQSHPCITAFKTYPVCVAVLQATSPTVRSRWFLSPKARSL